LIFYDAGEEQEARKDALKVLNAGVRSARIVVWPPEAVHGTDINGQLVENSEGFEQWTSEMIAGAKALTATTTSPHREGEPDAYSSFASFASFAPESAPWPELAEEARYGLVGNILETIGPHTEADTVAVLGNLLCWFGNAIGRGAFVRVGADLHYLNLFVALVGETAKGRKGTSRGQVRDLMYEVDLEWAGERVLGGLSSGEGLIFAVRDRVIGEDKKGEEIVLDAGVEDKRLLVE
jgi:hypothetical protein